MIYGPAYLPFEKIHHKLSFRKRKLAFPPMPGGRAKRLIENGTVKCLPNISRFDGHHVIFETGARLPFDLVVFATGFEPALSHIPDNLRDSNNLYLLGTHEFRTFRSRFLRGIREDAIWVANDIESKRVDDHS